MKVFITPRAEAQIEARRAWWRQNRQAAPELFDDELSKAVEQISSAPGTLPPPPAVAARFNSRDGKRTGKTSSIARAATTRRFAIRKYSHGFVLTDPNSVPVRPAKTPSAA